MQDKLPYSKNNIPRISEDLQLFINELAKEVVFEQRTFDDISKRWLKKYSENEGVDFDTLLLDLGDFFTLLKDYSNSQADPFKRLLVKQAQSCYISKDTLELLIKAHPNIKEKTFAQPQNPKTNVPPIIKQFSINGNNGELIVTSNKNLSLFIEANNTDKIIIYKNGISIKSFFLRGTRQFKEQLNILISEVGEYEIMLKTFSIDGQSYQSSKKVIVKEKEIEAQQQMEKEPSIPKPIQLSPPEILTFSVNGDSNHYMNTSETKLMFYINVQYADKIKLLVNGYPVDLHNLKVKDRNIKVKYQVPFQEETREYNVELQAISNDGRKTTEMKKIFIQPLSKEEVESLHQTKTIEPIIKPQIKTKKFPIVFLWIISFIVIWFLGGIILGLLGISFVGLPEWTIVSFIGASIISYIYYKK